MGTVCIALEGGKSVAAESLDHAHDGTRPFEQVVMRLEDLAVGLEAVDEDNLCICEAEISYEWGLWVLS